ncbi:hypothetical protein MYAM1_000708 [Malassezia yamatoensis]|uniref:Urease accessory protein UreD n=1 Tax=Malassezia yamatoensis TaxID=253288 RepID=A0AAJ5YUQ7_9BASI|nr:hypothetical protein MYAM1_000708 [Malassezia yamatoensis]
MSQERYSAQGKASLRRAAGFGVVGAPIFSQLEGQFPLRLLTPHASCANATLNAAKYGIAPVKGVGVLYVVNYGGGLVSGDHIDLDYDVGSFTRLLLLTQGSTKVYCERRPGDSRATLPAAESSQAKSSQYFRYIVRPEATLVILTSPITCFARSRYDQTQLVDLRCAKTSSLVLVDWFTSGRLFVDGPKDQADQDRIPEFWHFYLYRSRNEVRLDGQVIARDCLELAQDLPEQLSRGTPTELSIRCAPYNCYATVILCGPEVEPLCDALQREFNEIQQSQPLMRNKSSSGNAQVKPENLIWCASPITSSAPTPGSNPTSRPNTYPGLLVRVAGVETDDVRHWLHEHLSLVRHLIGDDMYKMGLGT